MLPAARIEIIIESHKRNLNSKVGSESGFELVCVKFFLKWVCVENDKCIIFQTNQPTSPAKSGRRSAGAPAVLGPRPLSALGFWLWLWLVVEWSCCSNAALLADLLQAQAV